MKPFSEGMLYLGEKDGVPVGYKVEANAITIAKAGTGKTSAVLIPNILRWPHNLFVIDVKSENVNATWQNRVSRGKRVAVLDPYHVAEVPDGLRASFNPLAGLDPASPRIVEDIKSLTKAIVKRHDPKAAHWDDGAETLIAGIIFHLISTKGDKTLALVRRGLTSAFSMALDEMRQNHHPLCQAAVSKAETHKSEAGHFLSAAVSNTDWLDSPSLSGVMTSSTFNLSEIRTGNLDVFLVLPPEELENASRFLRVFLRCALREMSKVEKGNPCLFLLDEFYSLGKMEELQIASGLLRARQTHLWPFLQNMGQLIELYGQHGSQTFFANADIHMFFGVDDYETLEHISRRLGVFSPSDIPVNPPTPEVYVPTYGEIRGTDAGVAPSFANPKSGFDVFLHSMAMDAYKYRSAAAHNKRAEIEQKHREAAARDTERQRAYQHAMANLGRRRMPPDDVGRLIAKRETVTALVFGGGDAHTVTLVPWFRPVAVRRRQIPGFLRAVMTVIVLYLVAAILL